MLGLTWYICSTCFKKSSYSSFNTTCSRLLILVPLIHEYQYLNLPLCYWTKWMISVFFQCVIHDKFALLQSEKKLDITLGIRNYLNQRWRRALTCMYASQEDNFNIKMSYQYSSSNYKDTTVSWDSTCLERRSLYCNGVLTTLTSNITSLHSSVHRGELRHHGIVTHQLQAIIYRCIWIKNPVNS